MLSLLLAAMTALAIAAVGYPLLRRRGQQPAPRREHDLAVYRDQLAELERDQARGVLEPAQAAAARLEIERRLLAAAKQLEVAAAPRPQLRRAVLVLGTILPLAGFGFYLMTGRPDLPAMPFAEQIRLAPNQQNAQRQIDELSKRLTQKPDDVQGWIVLGRLATAIGQYDRAVSAFARALTLAQDRTDLLPAYAQALVLANKGVVTQAALQVLDSALAKDPNDPTSNFYRGAAELQAGDVRAALTRWLALEARSAPDAPYLMELRRQIAIAAAESGIDPQSIRPDRRAPPSGPSADDVDRLNKMSPQERQQTIKSMVDGLEAKLRSAPDDVEGWRRLGRARMVLNEFDKAAEAFRQADQRTPNDPAILADLAEAYLRAAPNAAPPPAAIETLRRLLAVDPNNALALYFLAAVEANAGNKSAARDMLDRLLQLIPANAPQRAQIEAQRKNLE